MKVKFFVLVSVVFGSALLADAQMPSAKTVIVQTPTSPERWRVRSDHEQRVGGVLQERGHVRIMHGTAIVTADEADITASGEYGPIDIELRGKVHVHVALAVPPDLRHEEEVR